jgi:diadenylate cyclase
MKAVTILSKNKYGALIILTRHSGVREYVGSGEQINANVNHKLLVNIFTPKAPLHDGAVIVSGSKIISAATTLPLSEDVFDLSLGTRHKAALSLSMETDAIGLIVSEETGVISLAVNGRLQRNLRLDDLRDRVISLLSSNRLKLKNNSK